MRGTPCLLQADRCHLSSQTTPFPLFLCHVLQHTCSYLCTPGILIPTQISSHFSRETYASALHKSVRAGNSQLASLGSADPSPPRSCRALPLLAHFRDPGLRPAGLGPFIQGQFLPYILLLLLYVFLLFLFFTDTWQKKNNPAPHGHFNNSYSTSVTGSLINKYLLEYNNFLKQAVFRNEITIITCKNMYE